MRRHRPVIAQSTDAVNKISSCMLVSSHTMRCAALHRETIWVRHSGGPPFRGFTVIITLTLSSSSNSSTTSSTEDKRTAAE